MALSRSREGECIMKIMHTNLSFDWIRTKEREKERDEKLETLKQRKILSYANLCIFHVSFSKYFENLASVLLRNGMKSSSAHK